MSWSIGWSRATIFASDWSTRSKSVFAKDRPGLIETAAAEPTRLRFSESFECKYDGTVYATPEPRLFSFNNPFGACPTCQGFGNTIGLDLDLVIPNPGLTLDEGAIEPWTKPQYDWARTS